MSRGALRNRFNTLTASAERSKKNELFFLSTSINMWSNLLLYEFKTFDAWKMHLFLGRISSTRKCSKFKDLCALRTYMCCTSKCCNFQDFCDPCTEKCCNFLLPGFSAAPLSARKLRRLAWDNDMSPNDYEQEKNSTWESMGTLTERIAWRKKATLINSDIGLFVDGRQQMNSLCNFRVICGLLCLACLGQHHYLNILPCSVPGFILSASLFWSLGSNVFFVEFVLFLLLLFGGLLLLLLFCFVVVVVITTVSLLLLFWLLHLLLSLFLFVVAGCSLVFLVSVLFLLSCVSFRHPSGFEVLFAWLCCKSTGYMKPESEEERGVMRIWCK